MISNVSRLRPKQVLKALSPPRPCRDHLGMSPALNGLSGVEGIVMSASNDFVVEQMECATVIVLGPRISGLDIPDLAERRGAMVDALRSQGASTVIVDFSQVEYFGSLL